MSRNCKYSEIHSTEIGAVLACARCGMLKVEIGNMMALISPTAFNAIHSDFIESIELAEMDKSTLRPMLICLNEGNLFLKLTPKEFLEVVELFSIAKHLMTAQSYINAIA